MSVEFGIITSVVPPNSWHYPQVLSSGETVKITGYSFEQLQANMQEFRQRHSDLCGGAATAERSVILADIKDYFCRNFPQNCADARSAPSIQSSGIGVTNYVTPINKAADWLAQIGNQQIE